jgi:hypothetical protein
MIEAASTSETTVNFYQTTRRNNPEDSRLHTRRRENLKSHIISINQKLVCLIQFCSLLFMEIPYGVLVFDGTKRKTIVSV